MRNGFWGNGVGRFVLSCTAISAIGLGIGAFGPGVLAWMSKPAQAQDIMVLPKDAKPAAASSVPYMSLVPSAQATRPVQQEMPVPAQLRSVPGLVEPLVADGMPSIEQEQALAGAIAQFVQLGGTARDFAGQVAPLQAYLAKYPSSPWSMALQADLGFGYYNAGYYSRAMAAFQQAWQLGRNSETVEVKRLADRAIAELVRMHARIGHADEIDRLLGDLGDRPLTGAATEFVSGAREGAWVMRNRPEIAYLCGPKALVNVMRAQGIAEDRVKVANEAESGPHGFNLTQLSVLANKVGVTHQVVYRAPGQPVPVPSIINWKLNHYAAIVAERDGRFVVKDPTFDDGERVITRDAIDAEGSGYFIVPAGAAKSASAAQADPVQGNATKAAVAAGADWRSVDPASDEAKSVYGMGYDRSANPKNTFGCAKANPGMCGSGANPNVVSITISDTPVGYQASKGFKTAVTLTYNQREATQPANFTYSNVGQKWNINTLSYILDDPTTPYSQVERYVGGGGALMERQNYLDFQPEPYTGALLKRNPRSGAITDYTMLFPDGSKQVFTHVDGATSYPRKVFLTQIVDPQGNTTNIAYDAQHRVTSVTDAAGLVTTFTYGLVSYPLLVTQVTDPFGRYTSLTYDASQRLASITDPAGITSSFHYDAGGLIDQLKTPYGQTSYAYGDGIPTDTYYRWLQTTDPLGFTDRMEYVSKATDIPDSDPAAQLPSGVAYLQNWSLRYNNTFYWDKFVVATQGTSDRLKAYRTRWTMDYYTNGATTTTAISSIKKPLENRLWFRYPGSSDSNWSGYTDQPYIAVHVIDDGTNQQEQGTYDTTWLHFPQPLTRTDGVGRVTKLTWDTATQVDLLTVQQQVSSTPTYETVAAFTYNTQHLPLTYTDAAGQVWKYAYNTAGQMIYATNPLSQTRFWEYDSTGRITRVTTPVAVAYASVVYGTTNTTAPTAKSYNYSSPCSGVTAPANTNLPISVTDSEGYTLCYQYDALDRVTKVKYPDGTTDQYDYNFPTGWTANGVNYGGTPSLDVWKVTDRLGRIVNYSYDRNRQLISKSETVKVAGTDVTRTTGYSYYPNGVLKELTDANGAVTHWEIDIESRPTSKTYAFGTANAKTETYTYETTTSRLKSITDAKGQTVTYTYNKDNSIASYAYTNAVVATAGASFTYDPWYPRRTGMTDQYGTTSWTYKAVGTNGALGLDTEDGPFSNDTVAYGYDAAGRVSSRTIPGGSAESLTYDLLGRLSTHGTDLGSFTYGYLGNSGQVTSRTVGSIVTSLGYDTNTNDRRLLTISTTGAVGRNFTYTSNAYQLTGITDTAPVSHPWLSQTWSYSYDASDRLLTGNGSTAGNSSFGYDRLNNATSFAGITGTYNNLNQISTFNGTSYTYDANGNLTSDGTRTYTYDAADRLLTVTQGSAVTTYGYDGLGRRVKRTYANGSSTETRYLWCGIAICQTRDGTDTVTAKLFAEGEYRPSGTKKYLYLTDHLGSVRDVIDLATTALVAAFDYTPYGAVARSYGSVVPLYQYAMLMADPNTGLYLSLTRPYNPTNGKWLNSDPIREAGGVNLTGYVGGAPTMGVDPLGLDPNLIEDFAEGAAEGAGVAAITVGVVALLPVAIVGSPVFLAGSAIALSAGIASWASAMETAIAGHCYHDIARLLGGAVGGAVVGANLRFPKFARGADSGADNAAAGALLREHLRQLERYGSQGFKILENGRIRYYGDLRPARTPGNMAGNRTVREWDPVTGAKRTWLETIGNDGGVYVVRPETGSGDKTHFYFDGGGGYIGKR